MQAEEGTPQGGSASPLLANVYLHYVFDLWVRAWRQEQAHGGMIVVSFADDLVLGFQYKSEAGRVQKELAQRLRKFGLELHPDRTRLAEFGRFAETIANGVVKESPRLSPSSALPTSAARRERADSSRCCARRYVSGCRPSWGR